MQLYVFRSKKLDVEDLLYTGAKWARVATLPVFLSFFFLFLFSSDRAGDYAPPSRSDPAPSVAFERIGQGLLSLSGSVKKHLLPRLDGEIVLLEKSPFADPLGKKPLVLLRLKSSADEYKARIGEQIFLSCDSSPGGLPPVYRFSALKTPLWIRPVPSDGEGMKLEVGLFTPAKESGVFFEEKTEIEIQKESQSRHPRENLPFIEMLENGKLWGEDVVFSRFAGQSYAHLKNKVKLEIPCFGKTVFCFLSAGDLLVFRDGEWIPGNLSGDEEFPLAVVKKTTRKSMELEVWDPGTFSSRLVTLEAIQARPQSGKGDSFPHTIRRKSDNRVRCSFGKRKYLLKEGDWVVKTKRGWRRLKRTVDTESYLRHAVLGELFIFDSLVKEQGKLVMKGFLIDEMRTQAQPFAAVITVDERSSAEKKGKAENSFSKIPSPSVAYIPAPSNLKSGGNAYE